MSRAERIVAAYRLRLIGVTTGLGGASTSGAPCICENNV